MEYRFDQCAAALEEEVLGVGTAQSRPQQDAAARAHRPAVHQNLVVRRVGAAVACRVPPRLVRPDQVVLVGPFRHLRKSVGRDGRWCTRLGDLPQGPHRAVQPLQDLGGHGIGQVDHCGRPVVRSPGLTLLVVGQGGRPQGEDLVDLRGVVQRSGALRGDGRVVLKDDRGREHQVRTAGLCGQYGPGVQVPAARDCALGPLGRVRHRQERACVEAQEEVGGHQ